LVKQTTYNIILLLAVVLTAVFPISHAQPPKSVSLDRDAFDDFIALRMKTERRRATFKDAVTPAFDTSAEGWDGRDYSFFAEESPEAAMGMAYLQNLNYYPELLFLAPPIEDADMEVESAPLEESKPQASAPKKSKGTAPIIAPPIPSAAPDPPQQNDPNKGQEKKEETHKWKPGDNLKKAGKKVSGVLRDTFDGKDGKKKK